MIEKTRTTPKDSKTWMFEDYSKKKKKIKRKHDPFYDEY